MKKLFFTLTILAITCQSLSAQIKLSGIGGNLGTNLFFGDSRVLESTISPNIGVFGIVKFSDFLSFKLQTGFGMLGSKYGKYNITTSFIPIEIIGMFSLKPISGFTPFFHAGIGTMSFKIKGTPKFNGQEKFFHDGMFIGGGGFSYPLSSRFTLTTSIDMRYTTGDDFNVVYTGMKDAYISFQTGIAHNLGRSGEKYKRKEVPGDPKIIAQNAAKPPIVDDNSLKTTIESKPDIIAEVVLENERPDNDSKKINLKSKPDIIAEVVLEDERINELMDELINVTKNETVNETKNERINELINELVSVTINERKNELINETKNELVSVTINERKSEPINVTKTKTKIELIKELKKELINETNNETVNERINELISELVNEAEILTEEKTAIKFEKIHFGFDKTELTEYSKKILEEVISKLNVDSETIFEIHGHADSIGGFYYNIDLSLRRAVSIRDYLVRNGIKSERLITKGFGEKNPIDSNSTKKGREKNRRGEFVRLKNDSQILTEVKE